MTDFNDKNGGPLEADETPPDSSEGSGPKRSHALGAPANPQQDFAVDDEDISRMSMTFDGLRIPSVRPSAGDTEPVGPMHFEGFLDRPDKDDASIEEAGDDSPIITIAPGPSDVQIPLHLACDPSGRFDIRLLQKEHTLAVIQSQRPPLAAADLRLPIVPQSPPLPTGVRMFDVPSVAEDPEQHEVTKMMSLDEQIHIDTLPPPADDVYEDVDDALTTIPPKLTTIPPKLATIPPEPEKPVEDNALSFSDTKPKPMAVPEPDEHEQPKIPIKPLLGKRLMIAFGIAGAVILSYELISSFTRREVEMVLPTAPSGKINLAESDASVVEDAELEADFSADEEMETAPVTENEASNEVFKNGIHAHLTKCLELKQKIDNRSLIGYVQDGEVKYADMDSIYRDIYYIWLQLESNPKLSPYRIKNMEYLLKQKVDLLLAADQAINNAEQFQLQIVR